MVVVRGKEGLKSRDLIYCLKIPNLNLPQYKHNSNHMAELARDFHNDLQSEDLAHLDNPEEYEQKLQEVMDAIPASQKLEEPHLTEMNWSATEAQIAKAIDLGKNKMARGLDRCSYKLWKALKTCHESLLAQPNTTSFNVVKTLTELVTDIQTHGLDPNTDFVHIWMCPMFKKKDLTEIGNYHPISLINTDYKVLTKVMGLQLNDHA